MRFRSKSLAGRLVVYFSALLVSTVSLMGILVYVMVRHDLVESLYVRLDTALDLKLVALRYWIQDQRQEVALLAGSDVVQTWVATLEQNDADSAAYKKAYAALSQYLGASVLQKAGLREIFVLTTPDARVLISTDASHEGIYHSEDAYFVQGSSQLYVQSVYFDPIVGAPMMTVASPMYRGGKLLGVLVAHLNLDRMHELLLEQPGLGSRGEMYLVARPGHFIAASRADLQTGALDMNTVGIQAALNGEDGHATYTNYAGKTVAGAYRWLEEYDMAFLAEIEERESIVKPTQRILLILLGGGGFLGIFAIGLGYVIVRRSMQPLQLLNTMAQKIAAGDLEQVVPVLHEDDVGTLTRTFNAMSQKLRHLYTDLDQGVQVRLETLEHRNRQLEAAAQISSTVSVIYEIDRLLNETVHLIVTNFHFDYAGIFILDEGGDSLSLQAAASGSELPLLTQRYKLHVGQGIIGMVAQTGSARIVADVETDADFVSNPDISAIRSEMAVPLRGREGILGVLDVQSINPGNFTEEDAAILQTMAEQIALAIQNSRLLQESERAVRELERRYGEQTRDAWQFRLAREPLAYRYSGMLVEPLAPEMAEVASGAPVTQTTLVWDDERGRQLVAPIRLRDQVLGSIVLRQGVSDDAWTEADVALLAATCDQIGLALDNARLLDESKARAARERLTSEVSARIRDAAIDVASVLQVTAYEMAKLLQAASTVHVRGGEVGPTYLEACEYAYDATGAQQAVDTKILSLKRLVSEQCLVIPLVLREQVVGAVRLDRTADQFAWAPEEVQMVDAIGIQVGLALENAQLLVESRQRAARQQQLNEISRNFSQSLDMEVMLRTAARELGRLPGVAEAAIHITASIAPKAPEDAAEDAAQGVAQNTTENQE
ncbi:MAG: GAF domain-containing protein [Anaerolineae bacterium]|nr:GAF domain-containing protein [Anaerolineae bacterium]